MRLYDISWFLIYPYKEPYLCILKLFFLFLETRFFCVSKNAGFFLLIRPFMKRQDNARCHKSLRRELPGQGILPLW